jgi:hypothetical protein
MILVVSCSDNPQNKAAKEVRRKIQEALDIVDSISRIEAESMQQRREETIKLYTQARTKIKNALSQGQKARINVDPALLVSGNLALEQSNEMWLSLMAGSKPMVETVDAISANVHKMTHLSIEQDKAKALIQSIDVEAKQIQASISGDGENVGLKKQLAAKQAELAQLQMQADSLATQLEEVKKIENEIQRRANEKFRQSEQVTGSAKLELKREGYEILQTKKDSVLMNMALVDKIEDLESRMSVVDALASEIQEDLNTAEKRLTEIKNSPRKAQIQQRITEASGMIADHNKQVGQLKSALEASIGVYSTSFDEIAELLKQACGDYKKARSESTATAAKVRLADSYGQAANMGLLSMRFHDDISLRLADIASSAENMSTFNSTADAFTDAGSGYGAKAAENYDEAIKIYETLSKSSRRLGKEFECDVMKNYLLALHGRITLAEELGDDTKADELLAVMGELMTKADEFGAVFTKSATARILSGETFYIPTMSVDNTAFYEEFKKQFLGWSRLNSEEREAKVNELLVLAEQKKAEFADEEFDRIIDPEIQRLKDAIAKGFEDEVVIEVSTDPNYI